MQCSPLQKQCLRSAATKNEWWQIFTCIGPATKVFPIEYARFRDSVREPFSSVCFGKSVPCKKREKGEEWRKKSENFFTASSSSNSLLPPFPPSPPHSLIDKHWGPLHFITNGYTLRGGKNSLRESMQNYETLRVRIEISHDSRWGCTWSCWLLQSKYLNLPLVRAKVLQYEPVPYSLWDWQNIHSGCNRSLIVFNLT